MAASPSSTACRRPKAAWNSTISSPPPSGPANRHASISPCTRGPWARKRRTSRPSLNSRPPSNARALLTAPMSSPSEPIPMNGWRAALGGTSACRRSPSAPRSIRRARRKNPNAHTSATAARRAMAALRKRIVVTGSTGNLGKKAVAALSRLDGWEIVRIGRNAAGEPGVIAADLERYDAAWVDQFKKADAVFHLAADPKPIGTWESIARLNIDLALNVFRAAEEARVRRLVFASSNWVLGGYRFRNEKLTADLSPRPVNPYGASKLFMERYGLALAARTGISVFSLRIGYCQPGPNRPGPHMAFGRWGQEMWLGNRDWEQAVIKAVASP